MEHTPENDAGHVWQAVGPNAAELWNQCANCRANEGSTQGRLRCPRPRLSARIDARGSDRVVCSSRPIP